MFNKLKDKLKLKLIHWLEIDKLSSNLINVSNDLKHSIADNSRDIHLLRKRYREDYNDLDNKYDSLHRTIQSVVKMGADIDLQPKHNNRTGSWAVVCFERGKTNIVKFIDLDCQGRNGHEIFDYLKRFDASRNIIDTPFSCDIHRDFFYMWDKEEN
jgi:hypothetical protein